MVHPKRSVKLKTQGQACLEHKKKQQIRNSRAARGFLRMSVLHFPRRFGQFYASNIAGKVSGRSPPCPFQCMSWLHRDQTRYIKARLDHFGFGELDWSSQRPETVCQALLSNLSDLWRFEWIDKNSHTHYLIVLWVETASAEHESFDLHIVHTHNTGTIFQFELTFFQDVRTDNSYKLARCTKTKV